MKDCIVVGGGLCGLFSSILLAEKFENVTIIEHADTCGGLLKSVTDDKGIVYDQGTHIPNTTMVPEIDDILFGPEKDRDKNWNNLGHLKTGNFFAGKWDLSTQVVDTRKLDKKNYEKGILELLSLTDVSTAEDIGTYLLETIGPTFTNEIAAPLCKKLYGESVELSNLMTNSSVSYFGLSRVLGLNAVITKKLKEIPAFDTKLGYHTAQDYKDRIIKDGTEECIYYYPKNNNGVQFWIDHLVSQAKKKGVKFLNNESVKEIIHNKGSITSVILKNKNTSLPCDFLYWSAPPSLALSLAGYKLNQTKPHFKTANIFHFNFDKPINNAESHYIWNWDLSAKSFRVTLSPNLRLDDKETNIYNLTIEALSDADNAAEITPDIMLKELREMGLISRDSNVISSLRQTIHNTFPVPTFEFGKATVDNYELLNNKFNNIMVSGRFSGKQWFHADIIKAAYIDINERFN